MSQGIEAALFFVYLFWFGQLLSFDMKEYKTIIIRFYLISYAPYFLYHQLKIVLDFLQELEKFAFISEAKSFSSF